MFSRGAFFGSRWVAEKLDLQVAGWQMLGQEDKALDPLMRVVASDDCGAPLLLGPSRGDSGALRLRYAFIYIFTYIIIYTVCVCTFCEFARICICMCLHVWIVITTFWSGRDSMTSCTTMEFIFLPMLLHLRYASKRSAVCHFGSRRLKFQQNYWMCKVDSMPNLREEEMSRYINRNPRCEICAPEPKTDLFGLNFPIPT